LPVGAYGGRADVMDYVSPAGPVYQAGTLSGNPLAMAAGLAMLSYLDEHPDVYAQLEQTGARLEAGLRAANEKAGRTLTLNRIGSMYTLFFTENPVTDFASAKTADLPAYGRYFHAMLDRGVYLAPSQFESLFLSTALTEELVNEVVAAHSESLSVIF
ncbi:aminotransferase class III-fold pyridoxal phosphate-dependent enzyme, partial [Umezakia ovalisporum]